MYICIYCFFDEGKNMTKRPKIVGGKKGTSIFVAAPVTKNEDMSIKVFYLTEKKRFSFIVLCARI